MRASEGELVETDAGTYRILSSGPTRSAGPHRAPGRDYVLMHGIGMSHRYLARLHEQLARTAVTHSIDLPGFGGTPKPGNAMSIAAYAEVVVAALRRRGLRECVLVGHSMGAQFAIEAARRHPELISHVVVIGPVAEPTRHPYLRHALRLGED